MYMKLYGIAGRKTTVDADNPWVTGSSAMASRRAGGTLDGSCATHGLQRLLGLRSRVLG